MDKEICKRICNFDAKYESRWKAHWESKKHKTKYDEWNRLQELLRDNDSERVEVNEDFGIPYDDSTEDTRNVEIIEGRLYEPYCSFTDASFSTICLKHKLSRTCIRDLVKCITDNRFNSYEVNKADVIFGSSKLLQSSYILNNEFKSRSITSLAQDYLLNPRLGSLLVYNVPNGNISDWNSGTKFINGLLQTNDDQTIQTTLLRTKFQTKSFRLDDGRVIYIDDRVTLFGSNDILTLKSFIQDKDNTIKFVAYEFDGMYDPNFIHFVSTDEISAYRQKAKGKLYLTLCFSHFIDDFGRNRKGSWRPITGHYISLLNTTQELRRTLISKYRSNKITKLYQLQLMKLLLKLFYIEPKTITEI